MMDKKQLNSDFISAAECGHLDLVKYLLEKGADIHEIYNLALRLAAGNGHLEVIKYLVENGADIHARNNHALIFAVLNEHSSVVNFFVTNGADYKKTGLTLDDLPLESRIFLWNKEIEA